MKKHYDIKQESAKLQKCCLNEFSYQPSIERNLLDTIRVYEISENFLDYGKWKKCLNALYIFIFKKKIFAHRL